MISIIMIIMYAGWESQNSTVSFDLNGISCVSEHECWVVGLSGTILHTDNSGTTWEAQNSGTNEDLFGVSFIDSLTGWAVGYGPTILHTTDGGSNWAPQIAGTQNDLLNVVFVDANRGWATGVTGTIIGTSNGGSNWNSEISGQWAWLWGVAAISTNNAWAVGADWFNHIAPVYNYNGSSWQQQFQITATQDGKAVAAYSSNVVWTVGGNGTIYYSTNGGSIWTSQTSNTNLTLWDVAVASESKCWIVGSSGLILHTADGGTQWSQQSCPVSDSLFGIAMADEQNGWAVGENGVILHTDNGGYGIQEKNAPKSRPSMELLPNPVKSELHISAPTIDNGAVIKLYDVSGRSLPVHYNHRSIGQIILSTADLNEGAYFIVIDCDGAKLSRQFIKVR